MKGFLQLTISVFLISLTANSSFGCTVSFSKIKGFSNKYQYLFIGKVIGYTEKLSSKNLNYKTHGLKVKITEGINLPKQSLDYYEVIPIRFCSEKGYKKKWLNKKYPINSLVNISASESYYFPFPNSNKQIRLEASLSEINRNELKNAYRSSASSFFDYSPWKENQNFIDFELNKDLFRLNQATLHEDKIKILKRLAYNPNILLDFKFIVEKHLADIEMQKKLFDLREKAGYQIFITTTIIY